MHNVAKRYQKLRAVIRHDYLTIIKQKAFWLAMLAIPGFIALSFGVGYISELNMSTTDIVEQNKKDYAIAVVDQSGLVQPAVIDAAEVELLDSSNLKAKIEDVRTGGLDGLIVYPEKITQTKSYQAYINEDIGGQDNSADISSTVTGLGRYILQQSLLAPLGSSEVAQLALSGAEAETTTYENGRKTVGFAAYIVPGVFVVLFYITFFLSVGYAMTSVAEEKENRAIEMVLSYVRPRTLIVGKLISVTFVALTQLLFYVAFGVATYFVAQSLGDGFELPIEFNSLVFELQPIVFGALYFLTGFVLFVSFMLATGAAFPSAKEANSFLTVFYMLVFLPYIAATTIINVPGSLITQFATYFPLTAAPTLLLRNAVGNMSVFESLLGLGVLVVTSIFAVWLAAKFFKLGALNFNSRVKLAGVFRKYSL